MRDRIRAARRHLRTLIRIITMVLIGTTSCVFAAEETLPAPEKPPDGFEWYVFEAGNTACLRPLDWFVKTEVQGDTAALMVSKENLEKESEFKTGLTLNVVRRIQAKTGRAPSQYARVYLDALLEKHGDAKASKILLKTACPA